MIHDLIGDVLMKLFRATGLHRPMVLPSGQALSISDAMALAELRGRGPLSQRELADRLLLEKSTVSRLVAGLERQGWTTRERNPANRRYHAVELTPAGRAVIDEVVTVMRTRHDRILRELTEAEQKALRVGVDALVRALDRVGLAAQPTGEPSKP